MKKIKILAGVTVLFSIFSFLAPGKPTLHTIGDSTVHNANKDKWGWGTTIVDLFDTTKINIQNDAMAGRSTRTFLSEGRWDKVVQSLKPGDFVTMQFGHNEGSKPDTSKSGRRGVLKGIGEETVTVTQVNGEPEIVHTYGWYIRKFVRETKAKGATPIVVSMIPRNEFRDGKVMRANQDYGLWASEIAKQEHAYFVDLNSIVADKYDAMGPVKVKEFFPGDHTHTNQEGAKLNAASVVEGIRALKDCPLNQYLLK
ncbi:rhamnogalacturonan acetylesterase [Pedobacter sp. L105]|uniref:rhamnogalacturonan acetylesterase n=1 Tax=Pedobacter sp. L105 TaxID=1641871 RepID=UPI00131A8E1E|nr:rhamnogalacturonan acetylesterase [Pedobacter sp. L105]